MTAGWCKSLVHLLGGLVLPTFSATMLNSVTDQLWLEVIHIISKYVDLQSVRRFLLWRDFDHVGAV